MKLRSIVFPVVLVLALPGLGCVRNRTPDPPPPGGTYLSDSAGATFDQSVMRNDSDEGDNIALFQLLASHRPKFDTENIYIAAGVNGIVHSADGGKTWRVIKTPIFTSDVVVLENGVIVMSGVDNNGIGYILRTIDDAKSWETALKIPPPVEQKKGFQLFKAPEKGEQSVVVSLAPHPFEADQLYAGDNLGNILVGEQSGKTWRTRYELTTKKETATRFAVRDLIPSTTREDELLIITTRRQLFRVNEEGVEELKIPINPGNKKRSSGGQMKLVETASYVPQFPQALIVGVDDGAVITRDGGSSWEQLALPVDVVETFNSSVVAVSPTNPTRMSVAINNVVYRSEDGGRTWNTFTLQLPGRAITGLLIDPSNASHVLVVTSPIGS